MSRCQHEAVNGIWHSLLLLRLRHCLASKLSYLARFCPDQLFAEVTDELQIAIEAELRTIADAPREDFGGSKMRLARQTLRAGGTGVTP